MDLPAPSLGEGCGCGGGAGSARVPWPPVPHSAGGFHPQRKGQLCLRRRALLLCSCFACAGAGHRDPTEQGGRELWGRSSSSSLSPREVRAPQRPLCSVKSTVARAVALCLPWAWPLPRAPPDSLPPGGQRHVLLHRGRLPYRRPGGPLSACPRLVHRALAVSGGQAAGLTRPPAHPPWLWLGGTSMLAGRALPLPCPSLAWGHSHQQRLLGQVLLLQCRRGLIDCCGIKLGFHRHVGWASSVPTEESWKLRG